MICRFFSRRLKRIMIFTTAAAAGGHNLWGVLNLLQSIFGAKLINQKSVGNGRAAKIETDTDSLDTTIANGRRIE
jgi:hypothetical protein